MSERTFVDGIETIKCDECNGHGYYLCSECGQETTECDVCHGAGEVPLTITVTKGDDDE